MQARRVCSAACRRPVRAVTVRVTCQSKPVALVTGSSTGIGKACARRLEREGWVVYAGVRKAEDGFDVQKGHPGIKPVLIDVKDESSVKQAFQKISEEVGSHGVQAVVNNAGMCVIAPLEFMPIEQFNEHLQVNLVGTVRVVQSFLPLLRTGQQAGRIVNMSSLSGEVVYPLFGAYSASKYGMEAVSDALRVELHNQGIKVIVLQPGAVKSPIWDKSLAESTQIRSKMPPAAQELYGTLMDKITVSSKKAADTAISTDEVCDAMMEALTSTDPQPRYIVGNKAKVMTTLRKLLPDGWWDTLVREFV